MKLRREVLPAREAQGISKSEADELVRSERETAKSGHLLGWMGWWVLGLIAAGTLLERM